MNDSTKQHIRVHVKIQTVNECIECDCIHVKVCHDI